MNETDIQGSKVLIVDDTPANIQYVTVHLNRSGFEVSIANDGHTAIRQAKWSTPDIILLDVMMPQMDGFETCRQLKAGTVTKDIPVIFMTALSDTKSKIKGFEAGAVDYITKPLDHQEVVARISTHLTLRKLQKDLEKEVAEREKTEQTLREYTTVLQTQNEELDAFAHTVAHDLKSPLAGLTGLAELIHAEQATMSREDIAFCAGGIWEGGRKATNIVEELLLLSSVRQQAIEPERLNMSKIVSDSLQRLSNEVKHSQAEVILPSNWPAALGYAPWVEEVWVNYLSNAIKYGGDPPRVELGATEQFDKTIQFWVKDNGPGLSKEEQQRLFVPFTRLSRVEGEGYGLGLSIVHRIVEKLKGQVGVESSGIAGQGSVFNFSLPAA